MRSCFSVLWNGLSANMDQNVLNSKDKLRCQFQALNYLLLLDSETAILSKAPSYMESVFAKSCDAVSAEDASFILHEMHTLFDRSWSDSQVSNIDGSTPPIVTSSIYTLLEMALVIIKMLCKAGHHSLASNFLNDFGVKVKNKTDCLAAALELGKWAVEIHSMAAPHKRSDKPLKECSKALRSLPPELGESEAHSVLEGCGLVVWVVEKCQKKPFSGPVLLAWFTFLEEHQDLIIKILKVGAL